MAPAFSKLLLSSSDAIKSSTLVAASVSAIYFISKYKLGRDLRRQRAVDEVACAYNQKDAKRERIYVNGEFFRKLREILKICVPGIFTPEFFYLLLVAATLVGRTRCDLWMIHNGTVIERAIITRDKRLFWQRLEAFMFRMPLLSFVNNLLKFGLNELKVRLRTRLSKNLYEQYMTGMTYYQMNNLDSRIANPDQLLTQDVEKFCNSVIDLYSNVSKPILDILIYVQTLTTTIGAQAPSLMMAYLLVAGFFLTGLRKPVGRMTVTEQKLEGELRYVNSRVITNSEEVAFYNGGDREQKTLHLAFRRLIDHIRNTLQFQFCMGYIDNIVAKYWATVVGYFLISQPFFSQRPLGDPQGERLENYYRTGRMLVKLAEAIGRLVLAGRELTRLAGFTSRVHQLKRVLADLKKGHYERPMVQDSTGGDNTIPKRILIPGAGRIITRDNIIRFDRVPLVTPNGDILLEEMNFEVRSGMNVLICGPNGCGKSSLFRILGELWPLFGGTLVKPAKEKLFYIPQKPYMTLGTLRDQIIYPETQEDMLKKGVTDNDLRHYMELVQLTYLLDREGSWDSIQDWLDILSGGEKQRVAMARLFYRKPQFAILDECTSAVSVDVEGSMYQYCKEVGITLFTVSHRKSLWKYHEFYLQMDGRGAFHFKGISPETEEFGS